MNYLTVDLYDHFQCIAGNCPNTCCSNWIIFIDNNTYKKMIENETKLEISAKDWLFENNGIISVKSNNGNCPMLTKDGLCKVVSKLGPQYLSETCRLYPRTIKQYGSFIEAYLVLSCPEVITKLMEKETVEILVSKDDKPNSENYPHTELYLFEANIRTYIFNILKCSKNISLSARLFLSFTVLNESIQMYQNRQLNMDLFDKTCSKISTLPFIEEQLQNIINDSKRYDLIKQLVNIGIQTPNKRFGNLISDTVQYFRKNNVDQYICDIKRFKENFCSDYQNFYTNYWICRIFSDMVSIPDYEKSKEKFIYFAICFALIQTISMVSYINNNSLDKNEYIYIISCLDRNVEHNNYFHSQLISEINKNNLISAAGLLIFIIS